MNVIDSETCCRSRTKERAFFFVRDADKCKYSNSHRRVQLPRNCLRTTPSSEAIATLVPQSRPLDRHLRRQSEQFFNLAYEKSPSQKREILMQRGMLRCKSFCLFVSSPAVPYFGTVHATILILYLALSSHMSREFDVKNNGDCKTRLRSPRTLLYNMVAVSPVGP